MRAPAHSVYGLVRRRRGVPRQYQLARVARIRYAERRPHIHGILQVLQHEDEVHVRPLIAPQKVLDALARKLSQLALSDLRARIIAHAAYSPKDTYPLR